MLKAPHHLCCEFMQDPIGIVNHPHLSWWVNDPRAAEVQSAYEIEAASSLPALQEGARDLWHSGRIEGSENAQVPYQGLPVISGQQVFWRVRTYDSDAEASPWSEPAHFEMGLLNEADWLADWITGGLQGSRHSGVPAMALRKDFVLNFKPEKARLYLGVMGQALPFVNGTPVATCLGADWLDYTHNHGYTTIDVTATLTTGNNTLGILLAEGRYSGEVPGLGREVYGRYPLLRAMLVIESATGSQVTLSSDRDWLWRQSWVLGSDLHGETVDCRDAGLPLFAPSTPTTDWGPAIVMLGMTSQPTALPAGKDVWQREQRPDNELSRRPLQQNSPSPRIVVTHRFDQAMRGRVRLQVKSRKSDAIVVRYSLDGQKFTSEDRFTNQGHGELEVLQADLACHLFTAVQVEYGVRDTLLEQVVAVRMADLEAGRLHFRSDHSTLNRLVEVAQDSQAMLTQSAPLRGPQINQQRPDWGYAGSWIPTLMLNPASIGTLRRWLADVKLGLTHAESVGPYSSGRLPLPDDVDEWARFETLVAVLWRMYRHYNERELLASFYPEVRVSALAYRHQYGELLRENPRADVYGEGSLVATARAYQTLLCCARIATVLSHLSDQQLISQLASQVKSAFINRFLSSDGHLVDVGTSALVATLESDLLEGEAVGRAQKALIERVRNQRYQLDIAPILVGSALSALTTAGRLDMAYMVLLQTAPGSWMGGVLAGQNFIHGAEGAEIAQSAILEWIFSELMGVKLPEALDIDHNGFKHATICPRPPLGQQFQAGSPIQVVQASFASLYGQWQVGWEISERNFKLNLVLPPSCTADVELPDGVTQRVHSGQHHFVMEFSKGGDGLPTLLDSVGNV